MAFPSEFRIIYGNYFRKGDNRDGPYFVDENGVGTPMNGGGGGGGGGDASAANQVTGNASLASIDGKVATQTTVAAILARNNLLGTEVTLAAMSAKLPASLGAKAAAASLSVAPATDANVSRESYGTVTPLSIATSNPGTNFTQVGSQACTSLDLINNTGTALEYRRGAGGTVFIPVPNGTSRLIQGITNANTIYVRRVDQSNTVVTAVAEAFAV